MSFKAPQKKKRRTSRTGLLPSEDSSDKEDKLPSTSIPPWETTRHQLVNLSTCQMFCRVPRPCYPRAALAPRIVNSPRYGFQRSLVFASGFFRFVRFVFCFVFGKLGANCNSGITVMGFCWSGGTSGRDAGAPRKSCIYMNKWTPSVFTTNIGAYICMCQIYKTHSIYSFMTLWDGDAICSSHSSEFIPPSWESQKLCWRPAKGCWSQLPRS